MSLSVTAKTPRATKKIDDIFVSEAIIKVHGFETPELEDKSHAMKLDQILKNVGKRSGYQLTIIRKGAVGLLLVKLTKASGESLNKAETVKAIGVLTKDSALKFADDNFIIKTSWSATDTGGAVPNDALLQQNTNTRSYAEFQWAKIMMGMPQVLALTKGSSQHRIGVLDTGFLR